MGVRPWLALLRIVGVQQERVMLLHLAGGEAKDRSHQAVGGLLEAQNQSQFRKGSRQLTEGEKSPLQTGLEVGEHADTCL